MKQNDLVPVTRITFEETRIIELTGSPSYII